MKRFTETTIWDEDWFLNMPKEYMMFWFYLKDKCNHAGIWRPNLRLFEAIVGVKIDLKKAIEYFNFEKDRIQILKSGHWYILDFFSFQYGDTFNPANRVHKSIQDIYIQEDIILTSIRGLKEVKEGGKDKDKDKDKLLKEELIKYKYSKFYDEELTKSNEDSNYLCFVQFLYGKNDLNRPLKSVLSIRDQVSFEEYKKLREYSSKTSIQIFPTVLNLENNKKVKDYLVLYTTLKNWLTPKR